MKSITDWMKTITIEERWAMLAVELGVDAHMAGPPITWSQKENAKLDVVYAELIQPDSGQNGVVVLRVKTIDGRVLEFNMELEIDAVLNATDLYDEIDGELVEHDFDMSKPEEVARYFGQAAV